jgi:hypothetical protein
MRLSTLLLSLAAAGAVAVPAVSTAQNAQATPTARAASEQIDEEIKEALSQVQVRGQTRRHRLDADEARKVRGTYALSNGWTMRVMPRARQLYITINDGAPIELLAQSADKFASADGNIATVFNLGPWEEDVVMSYVPDSRLSDQRVIVGSGALAAR